MEVDKLDVEAGISDAQLADEDLHLAEDAADADAAGAEFTSGEVDQLLGEDDEDGIDLDAEVDETGREESGQGKEDGDGEEKDQGKEDGSNYGFRGRGMRRPFFGGMPRPRGGRFMTRGMMMMMGPQR